MFLSEFCSNCFVFLFDNLENVCQFWREQAHLKSPNANGLLRLQTKELGNSVDRQRPTARQTCQRLLVEALEIGAQKSPCFFLAFSSRPEDSKGATTGAPGLTTRPYY